MYDTIFLQAFRTDSDKVFQILRIDKQLTLRPVLIVVQVMGDISKQDCVHNKQIPRRTKVRICIHHQIWFQNPQYMRLLIYIGCIYENSLCNFISYQIYLNLCNRP